MKKRDIEIVPAHPSDAEEIAEIYRSLIGMPGCTWDEHYPTVDFVRRDIEGGDLFKAVVRGKIAGAAYMGDYEERRIIECFQGFEKLGEFGRVGVRRELHRTGVARTMLEYLKIIAKERGYDAIALLVGRRNYGAMALYEKIGFERVGESDLYDTEWYCYLYKLSEDAQ